MKTTSTPGQTNKGARNRLRIRNRRHAGETQRCGEIQLDLPDAISRGEISLHYQPQVDIDSGQIIGLEALARWHKPERGFISPSEFIPVAEKTGFIIPLGNWVFEETCRQAKRWRDEDVLPPQTIAVNVSAVQCKRPQFVQDVSMILEKWGVRPETIELELTETVLMDTAHHDHEIVERLRELGLRIAIDDFGTGYSSLCYLTNYPVDRLKIAKEFVSKVASDRRHSTIVRAIVGLANELGVEVLAEGVEDSAQVDFLVAAGCRLAQGFHYSAPVSAERATELLHQQRVARTMSAPAPHPTAAAP